jgi:hypothetical protein
MTNKLENCIEGKDNTLEINAIKFMRANRDMCDRLFESVVTDLKKLVNLYESYEKLDRNLFLDELGKIFKSLRALGDNGEIRTMLERANLVMLNKIAEDI